MLVLKQDPKELESQGPKILNYGELACSKDGHIFVGNERGEAASKVLNADCLKGKILDDFLLKGENLEENTFGNLKYSDIVKKKNLQDESFVTNNQILSYRSIESKYSSQSKESDYLIRIPQNGIIPYSFRIVDNVEKGFPDLEIVGLQRVEKNNPQGEGMITSIQKVTKTISFGNTQYFQDLERRIKNLENQK